MLAYVESIVACKVPKQTGRSIERHLAVGRTERCGFHRFPHPEKHRVQSYSTTVHTTFHGSITGWKQEPAAEEMHHVAWVLFCEIYTLKAEVFFLGVQKLVSPLFGRDQDSARRSRI